MNDLIKPTTYETLSNRQLPSVTNADSLDLNRELNLMRSVVVSGLSQKDDRLVAKTLETIASMLKKEQRTQKVALLSKDEIYKIADLMVELTLKEQPSIDASKLKGVLYDLITKEVNTPEDL